jgi:hypothetical protein
MATYKYDIFVATQAVNILNEAMRSDPRAIRALFTVHREPCNEKLAKHSTIQIRQDGDSLYSIGVLGLVNGLLGVDESGNGPICALIEDDGSISGFALRSKM